MDGQIRMWRTESASAKKDWARVDLVNILHEEEKSNGDVEDTCANGSGSFAD